MAIRLFSKISSTFNSNLTEVLHPRNLVKSAAICNINKDKVGKDASKDEEDNKTQSPHTNIPYKAFNVRDQSALSFPDLQPSTLPEYFNSNHSVESPLKCIEKPVVEHTTSTSQRIFEVSTTYKNVKLPLKQIRLAKPFPDPVKTMVSDTISDDEKAQQMQSDARYPGNSNSKNVNTGNFNPQYRSFATSSKKSKCKKPKKKCDKMRTRNCLRVPVSRECTYVYDFKRCKKQRAPYSSYSELCHTVLDSNPTECNMCPWTPQNHPTFKIKKRKYHTSAVTFKPKQQDLDKWLHGAYQSHGLVQEKETLKKGERKKKEKKLLKINKKMETPNSSNELKLYHSEKFSTKPKKKKATDQIQEHIIVQKLPSALKVSSNPPNFLYAETKTGKSEAMEIQNLKKNGKIRNKKEMVNNFNKLPVFKYSSKAKNVGYKPKKEKKFYQNWDHEETPSTINITINYFMAKKKDRGVPPGARENCPDPDPVEDDPCNLKRPGMTRECPKDLLIKKRRPIKPPKKKKCCPINSPKPNNPNQPNF